MGIGAFAYYRRVVENQKDRIIAEVAEVAQLLGSSPETNALFDDGDQVFRVRQNG